MDKVAIFARVSTTDNQEYFRQINDCTRVILKDGYTEDQIEIFAEKVSGYKKTSDRPELTRLTNILEANPKAYQGIYVTEVSRLGRNPRIIKDFIERLAELGVQLYIQNPELKILNADGSRNNIVFMMLGVVIEFADIEAKTTKTRMKSGKLQRAVEGKTSSTNLPYGYTSDADGYVIKDLTEATYVEQIYELYKQGSGTRVIAKTLNQLKVPTKFNSTRADRVVKFNSEHFAASGDSIKWSDVTVRQILTNSIYKGERKYLDTIIPIEPIVTTELFDECNELMKTKVDRNYLTTHQYLLKDLIRCGKCGRKYLGKYQLNGDKVYKCTSYLKSGGGCGNRSINISLIESTIFDQLTKADNLLQFLDNPNDVISMVKIELRTQEQLLKNEQDAKAAKERQLENLLKATTASLNPNLEMYNKLETEILKEVDSINEKIRLLTKDIFSKSTTLSNYNQRTASKEMILKAKDNRPELTTIYKQFIDKIIINDIGDGYVLANVFIKLKGVPMIRTLKLFIYANGVRKYGGRNEKLYKYLATTKVTNDPVYKDNVLMVDLEVIQTEFNYMVYTIQQYETAGVYTPPNKFVTIPKENYLYINPTDI